MQPTKQVVPHAKLYSIYDIFTSHVIDVNKRAATAVVDAFGNIPHISIKYIGLPANQDHSVCTFFLVHFVVCFFSLVILLSAGD